MYRALIVVLTTFICLPPALAEPPAGKWTITVPLRGRELTFLIMLSEDNGKWVGDFLGSNPALSIEPGIEDIQIKDDHLSFAFKFGEEKVVFDGKMTGADKPILGSFSLGGPLFLTELRPSELKNLENAYAFNKEQLKWAEGNNFFNATFEVLANAAENKAPLEDVRAIADRAADKAEDYGPRWQRTTALRLARTLAKQKPYVDVALEQARRAERLLDPRGEIDTQMEVLETLKLALSAAGKKEEVAALEKRLDRLEALDFLQYSKKFPPYKPTPFEGRKAKSDRVVLVELFTGAECPPCVAADLAFDGLESTFKPSEVVLLQYHLHIPGPDPLTNEATEARSEYYGDAIRGTPTIFFNGNPEGTGGGFIPQAKMKYDSYREDIVELLEKPAGAQLKVSATRKGDEITMKANVDELANPGEKIRLRFALAEEKVRYAGGNGLRYHHQVVRAMPGGPEGIALTKKSAEESVTINLADVRTQLTEYLDEFAKQLAEEGGEFPQPNRPMELKELSVIAFVQDDDTKEVLQASKAEVPEE